MCELRNRRGRGGREGLLVYNDCYSREHQSVAHSEVERI
jgi:hypothetical protein